jgi:hypothetical protein
MATLVSSLSWTAVSRARTLLTLIRILRRLKVLRDENRYLHWGVRNA